MSKLVDCPRGSNCLTFASKHRIGSEALKKCQSGAGTSVSDTNGTLDSALSDFSSVRVHTEYNEIATFIFIDKKSNKSEVLDNLQRNPEHYPDIDTKIIREMILLPSVYFRKSGHEAQEETDHHSRITQAVSDMDVEEYGDSVRDFYRDLVDRIADKIESGDIPEHKTNFHIEGENRDALIIEINDDQEADHANKEIRELITRFYDDDDIDTDLIPSGISIADGRASIDYPNQSVDLGSMPIVIEFDKYYPEKVSVRS